MTNLDFNQSPQQRQNLSQQKMEVMNLLMSEDLSNIDLENINKLRDAMGILSEPPKYKINP